jgi:hypothetical protein
MKCAVAPTLVVVVAAGLVNAIPVQAAVTFPGGHIGQPPPVQPPIVVHPPCCQPLPPIHPVPIGPQPPIGVNPGGPNRP